MLKAIVFDFDGVIADTFDLCFGINREQKVDITIKEYKDLLDGNVFASPVLTFSEKEIKYFCVNYNDRISDKYFFPLENQIKNLAKKYELSIISSSPEKGIEKFLKMAGISKYFQRVLGLETHKSKVEKFRLLFKEHKLKPKECIFVTDSLGDLKEAKKVMVPTIAVTWGYHGATRLRKGSPDIIIHNFEDLAK